jgi:glycosyltransferase involved in cell wall biosynthesis
MQGTLMKKILFIPHHPGISGLKIRINEIAKEVAARHETYVLTWNYVENEYTLLNRFLVTIKDLFKPMTLSYKNGMRLLEFPTLHRPVALAHLFNRFFLMRFIKKMKIDVVVNGSYYLFTVPQKRNFKYIIDIADLPADPSAPYIDRFTKNESKKADAVTVVSQGLVDYVKNNYGCHAHFLPNGANLRRMKNVTSGEIDAVKNKYKLNGKYVLGYIGYIGQWVNVKLAVAAFQMFKKDCPNATLLWIGGSPGLRALRQRYGSSDIIFTGTVHDSIEPYFRVLNMGLLPHRKCEFQDMAFHLKLIEYTAAGTPVVATPLEASLKLGFPNIIFAIENEEMWTRALLQAKEMRIDADLARCTEPYDWKKICERFDALL